MHSQQVFELEMAFLDECRVILVTPKGRQVTVDAPLGSDRNRERQEFQAKYTIKDLAIHARLLMGLEGYTPIRQTMRIVHEGRYLPMHQPLVTLCPLARWHRIADTHCTFCHSQLQNKDGELGPYAHCRFCLDGPTWHHGYCCPHNPKSRQWNGTPHLLRYNRAVSEWNIFWKRSPDE